MGLLHPMCYPLSCGSAVDVRLVWRLNNKSPVHCRAFIIQWSIDQYLSSILWEHIKVRTASLTAGCLSERVADSYGECVFHR